MPDTKRPALPEELLNKFKAFIAERGGLYFKDHDLRGLEDAVNRRMDACGIESAFSYYGHLTVSEEREDELRELLNLLTVNHTYFFRNEPQFKVLKERVLPEIIKRKRYGRPSLRIWSAGCSTGEEPYSIAMVVREAIPDLEGWDLHILATDASSDALRKAKNGVYAKNSLKYVSEDYIGKYFHDTQKDGRSHIRDSGLYEVADSVKNMVTFGYFNLMEEEYPHGFDIIFCRNVVIYFELPTTLKVMNKFHSSLNGDGYMFIGYSETLQFMQDKFQMVCSDEAIYYRNGKHETMAMPFEAGAIPKEEEIDVDKILDDISRAEVLAGVATRPREAASSCRIEDLLIQITKAIHLREYPKALRLAEDAVRLDGSAVEPYYLAAEVFVNQGNVEEAKKRLSAAIRLNSLFAPAHYLLGGIYMEANHIDKAKESFKRTLYLDKDFLLAHFYMALAFKSEGKTKNAIREYRNTIKLLSKASPSDIIAYSGGFNAATLVSVCRDNLERLKSEQES